MIIDLTIEDDLHRAILIGDRLPAAFDVDNGKTARSQGEAVLDEVAVAVGTTVPNRLAHPPHLNLERRSSATKNAGNAGDAAHQASPSCAKGEGYNFLRMKACL